MSEHAPPTFDHAGDGTPEEEWLHLDTWADVPVLRPVGAQGGDPDRLVVVVAHPDDETLAVAGLITWAADAGVACHVVVATDGEGSHPDSPTHTAEDLRLLRQQELVAAVRHLHPGALTDRLGLPDGRVASTPDPLEEALVDLVGPDTLLVSTWRHDGHPDHEAVARAASAVAGRVGARHLEAPIWLWHWGHASDVPWSAASRLDLTEGQVVGREAALAAYPSQHRALSPDPADAPVLGPGMLEHFRRGFETYLEHPYVEAPAPGVPGVFERLHRAEPDPWALNDSWYERRKRSLALAALPTESLGRVLEVGCSVGVLTAALAERAEAVLALDVSRAALDEATRRLHGTDGGVRTRFERRRVPAEWPDGRFDTVVLSEVGYFLTRPQWRETLERAFAAAEDSVLLVHWRHPARGWPLDGAAAHELARDVASSRGFVVATSVVDTDFLLDLWRPLQRGGIADADGKR